ncbi:alginate lyase family protein [Novipirellula artificiosorum]|nr:alginate lyase family protein [Novipirellula artificiosorum]
MTRQSPILLVLLCLCMVPPGESCSKEPGDFVLVDYPQLLERKQQWQQQDPKNRPEYDAMMQKADRVLGLEPLSVIHQSITPPSGDERDYYSIAPYWWPDPEKEDGLPWIRRDGRVNPDTQGANSDHDVTLQFFNRVNSLGMAAFYSDDTQYSDAAIELLKAWCIDPTTRMNPHLEYGQGVPGLYDGRCFGIIEWLKIEQLLIPIHLMWANEMIPEPTYREVVKWMEDYLHWLQFSEKGKQEGTRLNNHGTWYDVQVATILLFLGKNDEARELLESVKTKRIATQIEPDGRQPHELARTKSFTYSKMNLSAFMRLAKLGDKVGVDLLGYETPDGRSIRKAEAFLNSYGKGKKKWEYPQL